MFPIWITQRPIVCPDPSSFFLTDVGGTFQLFTLAWQQDFMLLHGSDSVCFVLRIRSSQCLLLLLVSRPVLRCQLMEWRVLDHLEWTLQVRHYYREGHCMIIRCMQDSFARARTRPKQPLGQARATIGYLVYKIIRYCLIFHFIIVTATK